MAYSLQQEGFCWRNDNGSQLSATWMSSQDVDITNVNTSSGIRLRIIVDEQNVGTAGAKKYELQYKKSTDSTYTKALTTTTTSPQYFSKYFSYDMYGQPLTLNIPTYSLTNDILLIFTYYTVSPGAGTHIHTTGGGTWTLLKDYSYSGSGIVESRVYWSRYNGTQTAPKIKGTAGVTAGNIFSVRGCITSGDPTDVSVASSDTVSDKTVTISGATTTEDNTLVFNAMCYAGTNSISSWANASLTNVTEIHDYYTVDDFNGDYSGTIFSAVATGNMVSAGTYGTTTATTLNNCKKSQLTFALKSDTAKPPIAVVLSPNLSLEEATTWQLTPPSGKTVVAHQTGICEDLVNPTNSTVTIPQNKYSEIEFALAAFPAATAGATYQLRLVEIVSGTPTAFSTYTVTPQMTIVGATPSGYTHTVNTVAAANIASISGVPTANIAKVNGV
jgi:hypothetical protein